MNRKIASIVFSLFVVTFVSTEAYGQRLGLFTSSLSQPASRPGQVRTETVSSDQFVSTNGDLWLGNPPEGPTSGILLRSLTSSISLSAGGSERMRIFADGRVAVGDPASAAGRLASVNNSADGRAIYGMQYVTLSTTTLENDYGAFFEAYNVPSAGVTNNGSVNGLRSMGFNYGPGTVAYTVGGDFRSGNEYGGTSNGTVNNATGLQGLVYAGGGTIGTAYGLQIGMSAGTGSIGTGYGVYIENLPATNDYGIYQKGADDTNYFAGAVGIGTTTPAAGKMLHVVGNAQFDGTVTGTNIRAKYQDVAEWVPSSEDLTPGMVVVLDRRTGNTVRASTAAYDTAVAGVVSAAPGVILGEESATKEQVATTGRVRVRVDASRGAIEIGDLLVTSDIPGTAMKSMPIEIGGVAIHRPGTIVGKALEAQKSGEAEILVLLSLQ
jgi:hypothetical protein